MSGPIYMSNQKANAISNGVFVASLGLLFYLNAWWPGILLSVWLLLGIRQYLTERYIDFAISSVILLGLFLSSYLNINISSLVPILFILGGAYITYREFYSEDKKGKL